MKKNLTVKAVWTPKLPAKGYTAAVNNLKYQVTKSDKKKGEVRVTGVVSRKLAKYTVPARVKIGNTYFAVTAIGAKAFKDCSKAKSFTLPDTITSIGKKAFADTAKKAVVNVPKKRYKELSGKLLAAGLSKQATIRKK